MKQNQERTAPEVTASHDGEKPILNPPDWVTADDSQPSALLPNEPVIPNPFMVARHLIEQAYDAHAEAFLIFLNFVVRSSAMNRLKAAGVFPEFFLKALEDFRGGIITNREFGEQAVLMWSRDPRIFERMAGFIKDLD